MALNVRIIDVRSQFECLADVCPMQVALGLLTYIVTNVGHPIWNWPDGTIKKNDKMIFLCQTGYRASRRRRKPPLSASPAPTCFFGGMLAWEDDWYPQHGGQTQVCTNSASDPSPGDSLTPLPTARR